MVESLTLGNGGNTYCHVFHARIYIYTRQPELAEHGDEGELINRPASLFLLWAHACGEAG